MATVVVALLGTLLHASVAFGQSRPLRFGIYSTAAVGTVQGYGATKGENQANRWRALDELRGTKPLVLRLYTSWDGRTSNSTVLSWVDQDVADARARGYLAEVVLRYRPVGGRAVGEYLGFVREAVRHFASQPHIVGLQITNEADIPGQPDASDGAYPGVHEALVQGVQAARDEANRVGRRDIKIGFNVGAGTRLRYWKELRRLGGSGFGRAVDWVGVDLYPQTWTHTQEHGTRAAGKRMKRELKRLRKRALPAAGIRRGARLHVSENGFPTSSSRSGAEQAALLRAAVKAVARARRRFGVSDYRWFSLRDANSAAPSFEAQYGLLRDDYSKKPAFDVYKNLIRNFSA
jgi:hypothetical protein